jgi:hypothetical protein
MNTKRIGAHIIMIASLFITACSAQIDVGVEGQMNEQDGSGTLDLDIGVGNPESSDQNSGGENASQQQQGNQPLSLQSEGLLIIIGIGLLVMIGLLISLTRAKGA